MNEIWKDISGYEGKYQVSSLGRVRNRFGKILAQSHKRGTNYLRVHLAKDCAAKWFSVHRLVAIAFLPMENGKDTVNHLDHNKENNCIENLEWCFLKDNCAYAAQEGRYHIPYENLSKGRALLKKCVAATSKDGTEYVFDSIAQAQKITGANRTAIANCCNRKYGYKTAAGFSWRFV